MQHIIRFSLPDGKVVTIDAEDEPLVSKYSWRAVRGTGGWYAAAWPGKKSNRAIIYLHNLIMKPASGMQVDHIDGDGLNCSKSNMRHATRSQNCANRKSVVGRSGYRGVWRQPSGKWVARLTCQRKQRYVGTFDGAEEAARAYDSAARECFGEFARTNFSTPQCNVPDVNEALTDWQRRLVAWESALPGTSGDERVLLACGIAVCVRFIHQLEADRAAPVPAGKRDGGAVA